MRWLVYSLSEKKREDGASSWEPLAHGIERAIHCYTYVIDLYRFEGFSLATAAAMPG